MTFAIYRKFTFPLILLSTAAPIAAISQSYESGGIQLTFGTAFRLEAADNNSLAIDEPPVSGDAAARLSFGLLTATPSSQFALTANGDIHFIGSDATVALTSPQVGFSYERSSADAKFAISSTVKQSDLSLGDTTTAYDPNIDSSVTGTAKRRYAVLQTALNWGETTVVGYGLSAKLEDITYSDGVAIGLDGTALTDNQRLTLGATSRLDLSQASQLKAALSYSALEKQDKADPSKTLELTGSLSIDRPLGALTATVGVTNAEDGQRYSASIGRTLDLPLGPVSGQIGVMHSANGNNALTTRIAARRELPMGSLNVDLLRDISSLNEQDAERLTTQLSLGYTRSLSPLSDIDFGFDMAQIEDTTTGSQSLDATLAATYSRALTADWAGDVGYRHRYLDEGPGLTANSNTIFLEVRRAFVTRY